MSGTRCEDARWPIALAVCALGASAVLTQLTLLRELLTVFAGNELVFGVILGNWMLLTGLGAALGRVARRLNRPARLLSAGLIVLAVLPMSAVLALRLLRNVIFLRVVAMGLTEAAVCGFVLLAPYCLCSGFLLTLACTASPGPKNADAGGIARVYFFDSVGGVVGGLVFSFVLVHLLGHVGILEVCAAVDLLAAAVLAGSRRRWVQLGLAGVLIAALAGLVAGVDVERWSVQRQHPRKRVVYHGNSPHGQLLVTADAEQYNFFSNGLPMLSTHDVGRAEETVHYAMAQRPKARDVLLVGGGVSGTADEILKYPVRRMDYVELDPLILEVAGRYLPGALADPRIHVTATDGRLFVKRTTRRYDVVIVDAPDPSTLQINRFYTVEFFRQVKRILRDGGVLCFSLGRYVEFVDDELASLIAVAHRTLREVFAQVLILPPGRIFFLASDADLTCDIADRLGRHKIHTRHMLPSYLAAQLAPPRRDDMRRALTDTAEVNRDFSPVLYLHQLRHWMSRFPVRYGLLVGGLAVVLLMYLLWIRPVTFAIFTTGFAASSLQIVLLVGFQILHGLVYHKIGIVVTMFMLGLAGGSLLVARVLTRWGRRHLIGLELAVGVFAALLPLVLIALGRLGPRWETISAEIVLPMLTLLLAVLVGMEVPLAARVDFRGAAATAGRMFLADLIGACLGAMLVSAVLIPLVSLSGVCFLTAGLNLVGGLVLICTRRGAAREVS